MGESPILFAFMEVLPPPSGGRVHRLENRAGVCSRRFANINNVCGVASALFLLPIAGTKEKAKQKENAVEGI